MKLEDVVTKLAEVELEIAAAVSKTPGLAPFEVIRSALAEARTRGADVENEWALPDPFHQRLFVALGARYSLAVYRRPKKRTFTVMVPAPAAFMREIFDPLFERMSDVIDEWLVAQTETAVFAFMAPIPAELLSL